MHLYGRHIGLIINELEPVQGSKGSAPTKGHSMVFLH